jgi:tRNA(Ile)-lysidine synthase
LISNLVSRVRAEVERAFNPSTPWPLRGPLTPLPERERRIIIAVSGGPDSLCLADAALAVAPKHGLHPVIAHLDHGLRGEASRADAEFVRAFAAERNVPCVVECADVRALAAERKLSIEVAAREARYAFLARAAEAHGASLVALAHHADDQAETVLFRLLRGTGLAGLRGMQPRGPLPGAPALIALRPLLRVTRAEIEQYCRECKLQPRRDATNDELHQARNRIRHELLPLLEQYNPNIRSALTRLADTVASDLDIVQEATRAAFERIATVDESAITVDRIAWRALSPGLQRETLREVARRLKGDTTDLPYAAIEEARDVLTSDAGVGEIALMSDMRITVAWREFVVRRWDSVRRPMH